MPEQAKSHDWIEYNDIADVDAVYHMARRCSFTLDVNDPDMIAVLAAGSMSLAGDSRGDRYLHEMYSCFEADYDQAVTDNHARRTAALLMGIDLGLYDAGKALGPERLLISLNRFLDECPPNTQAVYRPGVDTVNETLTRAQWPLRAAGLLHAAGIPELEEALAMGAQIFFNTITDLFMEAPEQGSTVYLALKKMYEFICQTADERFLDEFEERMTKVLKGLNIGSFGEVQVKRSFPKSIGLHALADLIELNPDNSNYRRQMEVLRHDGFGKDDVAEVDQAEHEVAIGRLMKLYAV